MCRHQLHGMLVEGGGDRPTTAAKQATEHLLKYTLSTQLHALPRGEQQSTAETTTTDCPQKGQCCYRLALFDARVPVVAGAGALSRSTERDEATRAAAAVPVLAALLSFVSLAKAAAAAAFLSLFLPAVFHLPGQASHPPLSASSTTASNASGSTRCKHGEALAAWRTVSCAVRGNCDRAPRRASLTANTHLNAQSPSVEQLHGSDGFDMRAREVRQRQDRLRGVLAVPAIAKRLQQSQRDEARKLAQELDIDLGRAQNAFPNELRAASLCLFFFF